MLAIVSLFEAGIANQTGGVVTEYDGFSVQPYTVGSDAGGVEEDGVYVVLQAAKLVRNGSQHGGLSRLERHIEFHVYNVYIAVAFVFSRIGVVAEQIVVLGGDGHVCQCQCDNKEEFLHNGNCENTQTVFGGKRLSAGVASVHNHNKKDNERGCEHRGMNIWKSFERTNF